MRIGIETDPTSTCLSTQLKRVRAPVICIDAPYQGSRQPDLRPGLRRANQQSVRAKSALPSTPDIHFVRRHVRKVPNPDMATIDSTRPCWHLGRSVGADPLRGFEGPCEWAQAEVFEAMAERG